jgi:hypothetical protein
VHDKVTQSQCAYRLTRGRWDFHDLGSTRLCPESRRACFTFQRPQQLELLTAKRAAFLNRAEQRHFIEVGVGIAQSVRTPGCWLDDRLSAKARYLFLRQNAQPEPGPHPASYSMDTGEVYPGGTGAGVCSLPLTSN